MSETNVAAVMPRLGSIELEHRKILEPRGREVVVRVEAVGVCGSDTTYYMVGSIGDWVVDGPIVLGHEAAGVVHAIGPEVSHVGVGDRVAVEPGTPCRDCTDCLAGSYHLCERLQFLATPPYDGALQQLLTIDERNLFALPDSMSFEEGSLLEPLSVGIWACVRARLVVGDHVLVTGAGPVGVLAAQAARAMGAASVTLVDVAQFRLDLAARLGFEVELSSEPSEATFDVLIECSGAPGVLGNAMGRLRSNGRAAMVGMPKSASELPLSHLNKKELSLYLVNRYAHTWPTAIALVASGRVDAASLHTHSFTLDETEDALTLASRDPESMKAIVYPQRRS